MDPGTENFPANNVTFDQAKAYSKWLAGLTGETYRLPNESEVSILYKDRSNENTLEYWAGYNLNPEDAAKLEAKIKELPGDAPLLREVGTFPGQGDKDEELIFDLGGNVSEWVLAANGSAKTLGGSADRPGDTKSQYRQADPAYTGFRVVHTAAATPLPATSSADVPEPKRTNRARSNRSVRTKPQTSPEPVAPASAVPNNSEPAQAPTTPDATPKPEPENPAPDSQSPQTPTPAPQPDQPPAPVVPQNSDAAQPDAPNSAPPAQAPEPTENPNLPPHPQN